MLEAVPGKNRTYGILGGPLETWSYGGTVNRPAIERAGSEKPPPKGMRAPAAYPTCQAIRPGRFIISRHSTGKRTQVWLSIMGGSPGKGRNCSRASGFLGHHCLLRAKGPAWNVASGLLSDVDRARPTRKRDARGRERPGAMTSLQGCAMGANPRWHDRTNVDHART